MNFCAMIYVTKQQVHIVVSYYENIVFTNMFMLAIDEAMSQARMSSTKNHP